MLKQGLFRMSFKMKMSVSLLGKILKAVSLNHQKPALRARWRLVEPGPGTQRSVIRQRLHAFARREGVDDGGGGEIDARYCALAVVTDKRKLAVRCEGKAH